MYLLKDETFVDVCCFSYNSLFTLEKVSAVFLAIIRIIVKKAMLCRTTIKPQSNADLSFSRDEILIKTTNAQISGREYLKWDLQTNLKPKTQVLQAKKKLEKIA